MDEYDETQESDVALTTTTNTDAIATGVMNVSTGKLAQKSKVAKAKQRAVEVRSNSDDDDTDDSAEELEGKYIP